MIKLWLPIHKKCLSLFHKIRELESVPQNNQKQISTINHLRQKLLELENNKIFHQDEMVELRRFVGDRISSLIHDTEAETGQKINNNTAEYAWDNWSVLNYNNTDYFMMHDNTFKNILYNNLLPHIAKKTTLKGRNPNFVLKSIQKNMKLPIYSSTSDFQRQTSYLSVTDTGKNKVLKIGLFRDIGPDKKK